MTDNAPSMEAQAIDWAVRVDAPGFGEWHALESWLAEDPKHAILFDAAVTAVETAARGFATHVQDVAALPPAQPARASVLRRWWALPALVCVLVAMSLPFLRLKAPVMREIATRAGEMREVALGTRGKAVLNGDSVIMLDPAHPDEVVLKRGQASFVVQHRADAPFAVRVNGIHVVDLGTRFDIDSANGTTIAIAEGSVEVVAVSGRLSLQAGQRVYADTAGRLANVAAIAPAEVAAWQRGWLHYQDTTVERLIQDVVRRTGLRLTASPELRSQRFAGSIDLTGTPAQIVLRLESLLSAKAQIVGDQQRLEPAKLGKQQ